MSQELLGPAGAPWGRLKRRALWAGEEALDPTWEGEGPPAGAWAEALRAEVQAARSQGVLGLQVRLGQGPGAKAFATALAEVGFLSGGERLDFGGPLAAWSAPQGSPLSWLPMPSLDPGVLAATADFIRAIALGDPDFDPAEDTLALLLDYLQDPDFDSGPDAVQLGSLGDRPVALLVAQVRERDGWGRITYMGLKEEARGLGLGRWVHAHGLACLQAMGATHYRGGTSSENIPMRRLFEASGFPGLGRLSCWRLPLAGAPKV